MGTGQTMLTIGALMLLGMTIITTNRNYLGTGIILNSTEIGISAVSLAQSIIEEAAGKAFDEVTVGGSDSTIIVSELSTTLGKDGSESTVISFDDFDDFHNLVKLDTIPGTDFFRSTVTVQYADSANPFVSKTSKAFFKLMNVWVSPMLFRSQIAEQNRAVADSAITMQYVFTYW